MNAIDLKQLYDATACDLRFGIGLLALPDGGNAPYIHIHQPGWTREMLAIVRESFQDGLTLTITETSPGPCEIYLATRQRVAIQASQSGEISVLWAPAWDARLSNIDPVIVRRFLADRARRGGFLLLIQTLEGEFLTRVDGKKMRCKSGPIGPRMLPLPARQLSALVVDGQTFVTVSSAPPAGLGERGESR